MNELQYNAVPSPTSGDVERAIAANDSQILKQLVVGVALHWSDVNEAERTCVILCRHSNEEVRGNAILGFGHLARRFGVLSPSLEAVIEAGMRDESGYVRGQAWAAADDVNHFLGWDIKCYEQGEV